MQELLILFTQVSELVAIQEVQIERVDEQAAQTTQHLKAGGDQLESGVQSARAARRKKWWCLGIAGKLDWTQIISYADKSSQLQYLS